MATYKMRFHFENMPSPEPWLGGNIYEPTKADDGAYMLIGIWGSYAHVETRYTQAGVTYISGYCEVEIGDTPDYTYTDYDSVIFAPSFPTIKTNKYLAVPMRFLLYGDDGYADIWPAFNDWGIL